MLTDICFAKWREQKIQFVTNHWRSPGGGGARGGGGVEGGGEVRGDGC
jgi:hypothetical protein